MRSNFLKIIQIIIQVFRYLLLRAHAPNRRFGAELTQFLIFEVEKTEATIFSEISSSEALGIILQLISI